MDSRQSLQLSHSGADQYYPEISGEAEILQRPKKFDYGQSSFYLLLDILEVPVLGRSRNRDAQDFLFIGQGASYNVTQALSSTPQNNLTNDGFLNLGPVRMNSQYKPLNPKTFVTKRIVPISAQVVDDSRQLAAITNEVRILANKSIRQEDAIVKLLGVAWDEVATAGRYWPRLLIEAADFGTLEDFLTTSLDASSLTIRADLLLDVLEGLKTLHAEGIAHCDLKVQNILIFKEGSEDGSSSGYKAKLCDFGFAIQLGDYEEDASLSARVGTEPWNAPELMGDTEFKVNNLPKSDIYSFGLLFAVVLLKGKSPFEKSELNAEEIVIMKRHTDDTTRVLMMMSMIALESSTDKEDAMMLLVLKNTLALNPDERGSIREIASLILRLKDLWGQKQNALEELTSEPDNDEPVSPSLESFSFSDSLMGKTLSTFIKPTVSLVARTIRAAVGAAFQPSIDSFGSVSDLRRIVGTRSDLLKDIGPIVLRRNETFQIASIPQFELSQVFNTADIPESVGKELYRSLLEQVNRGLSDEVSNAGESAYQLSIMFSEGIGVAQDQKQSLDWLEKAAILGSDKALSAWANILASLHCSMTGNLHALMREKLTDYAESNLYESLMDNFQNRQRILEHFTSINFWLTQDPEAYQRCVESDFFGEMKSIMFSYLLLSSVPANVHEKFDFDILEGFSLTGDPHFDPSRTDGFISSVRQHKCVESLGWSRISLLQTAALLGDINMAKALVEKLGAAVNAFGGTPGFTPLWIACLNGNFKVATFLLEHGADANVKDALHGRSILHFLNRFQTSNQVSEILAVGLSVGLAVDELDLDGNTPLLSTFIGWDISRGAAAAALLDANADPFIHSKSNFSAVVGALRVLDTDLLLKIFSHASEFYGDTKTGDPSLTAMKREKFLALSFLCDQTEFCIRRVCGPETTTKLQIVVDFLLSENLLLTAQSIGLADSFAGPLIACCYKRRNHLLQAMLNSYVPPDLDQVDVYGLTALHWCAERNNIDGMMSLMQAGANSLIFDRKGYNPFHAAARFAPNLLVQILLAIDDGDLPSPSGLNASDILEIRAKDDEKARPFALLVTEGSPEHLNCAEILRTRFSLSYDDYEIPTLNISIDGDEDGVMTLMGYLTIASVLGNIILLSQVEYILNLDPRPKFRANSRGKTLLHYSVCGYYHANMSNNSIGYAVLQLMLRTFPGKANVETPDDYGNTCVHYAAAASNLTALQIIRNHLSSRNDPFEVNMRNHKGETPLDVLGRMKRYTENMDNPYLSKIFKEKTEATGIFLRELGAEEGETPVDDGLDVGQRHGLPAGIIQKMDDSTMHNFLAEYDLDLETLFEGENRNILTVGKGGKGKGRATE